MSPTDHPARPAADDPGAPRGPLAGVTVIDLTLALAGPYATFLLAGLGATVIKVENPDGGDSARHNAPYLGADGPTLTRRSADDVSLSVLNRLRNKLGVTLNLKQPEAAPVFEALVARADILVDNFAAGTLARLGWGWERLQAINPRLVHGSISGFGADDASGAKAMDIIIQALSGVMMTSGEPGSPPVRIGIPIADLGAPLFAVIGILAALHQARATGRGQQVDVSMLGSITSLVASEAYDVMDACGLPTRSGATVPRLAPFGIYPARDGWVAICATMDGFARALFAAMGQPALAGDPRFATRDARVANVAALEALLADWTRTQPAAAVAATLSAAGVPAAEVREPAAAMRDPRVRARGETVPLVHPRFGATAEVLGTGIPIRFSAAEARADRPPPALGEHNDAVYGEWLGLSAAQLAALRRAGAI